MIAANLYAFEYENRTIKEIIMTPSGSIMAGFGIILTSIWMSIVLSFIPLLLSIIFLHFDFYFINTLLVYIAIIPLLVGFAGIGLLLAASFRQYRILQPIIILVTIGTYIIGGGFAGVNMLMPLARNIAEIWLFSIVFEWFNPILHNFSARLTIQQHVFILSSGAVGILLTFLHIDLKTRELIPVVSNKTTQINTKTDAHAWRITSTITNYDTQKNASNIHFCSCLSCSLMTGRFQ